MICEDPELLTDICDFTTLFYVRDFQTQSSKWSESSIESDLSMRLAIWNVYVAIRDFTQYCF